MRRALAGVSTRALFVAILITLLLALVVYGTHGGQRIRIAVENIYEDISDTLAPDAGRAFLYGQEHFSSRAEDYDIERAERFFVSAMTRDSDLPLVRHELARVYFLKGDFAKALGFINAQVALHGDEFPNTYYVRGLILGYMGNYDAAASDYRHFLRSEPQNWAAINDYAWVLLKADKPEDALHATVGGLGEFPDNPWLLNTNAIALFELGFREAAHTQAYRALLMSVSVTPEQWLIAYPGNDPAIAVQGITAFQSAIIANIHSTRGVDAARTVQYE